MTGEQSKRLKVGTRVCFNGEEADHGGCAHEHTGSAEASGIPCVMALRLIACSPATGLFCHRRLANMVCPPGWARKTSARLDANR
jgi:hypothetical protein